MYNQAILHHVDSPTSLYALRILCPDHTLKKEGLVLPDHFLGYAESVLITSVL